MSDNGKCATCHFWGDPIGMCLNTESPHYRKMTETSDTCIVWKKEPGHNDREPARHR